MDQVHDQLAEAQVPSSRQWKFLFVIIVCVLVVYAQTMSFDFVTYDDYELVYQNGEFLSHLSNIFTSFTTHIFTTHRSSGVYYRPLVLTSYIIDYQLWQLSPWGYHCTNILLHCITAILLFLLIEKILKERIIALGAGLLFALHPVQTQAVAWIAGRNDLLLGVFILSMICCYSLSQEGSKHGRLYEGLTVILFIFALFTKESAAMFILLLPLYDLLIRQTPLRSLFTMSHLRVFLLMIGSLLIYFLARIQIFAGEAFVNTAFATSSIGDRIIQLPAIASELISIAVIPVQLNILHPLDRLFWLQWPWNFVALLIVIALAAAIWWSWRNDRIVCFGLIWFAAGLLPTLNIVPLAVPILESRLYVPLAGFALAAVKVMHRIVAARYGQAWFLLFCFLLICVAGVAAFLRLPVWHDSETLWTDAIKKEPTVSKSYFNLAGYYFERQQYEKAIDLLKKYVELKPDDFTGYSKLRQTYLLVGKNDEAAKVNREILRQFPASPNRYLDAGRMFEELHQLDSAEAIYREGLQVDSTSTELHYHLGLVYAKAGMLNKAEEEYLNTLRLHPQHARALFSLGELYAQQRNFSLAIQSLERGIELGQPPAEILTLLSQLYMATAQLQKAKELAERYHF